MSDIIIYDGGSGFNSPWQNWSWSTVYTFAYTGVTAPAGHAAFQAVSTGYGGISFYSPTAFNTYNTFAFYTSADPSEQYSISLSVVSTSYSSASVSLASVCGGTLSTTTYTACFVDLTQFDLTYAYDRITLQSISGGTQTVAFADLFLSQKTVAQLQDQHAFATGSALGSNTLFLIGDGLISAVNVTLNGKEIPVIGNISLTTPIQATYFTLKSSWVPGNYTVNHANGSFSLTIPAWSSTTLKSSIVTEKISPLIYGYNLPASVSYLETYGTTLARWGGNAYTTYNHPASTLESGGFYNTDDDWYFENVQTSDSLPAFIERMESGGAKVFASLPALDWVAQTKQPCFSYNASIYGPSISSDPYNPTAGNGELANGSVIVNNPADCYEAWTPAALTTWLTGLNKTNVEFFSVDNEMDICDGTHVDIHPVKMTYDEELNRTLTFGAAIKAGAGEDVSIVGPTSCCFWFWWHSSAGAADAAAHGGVSKLRFLLRGWKAAEPSTGSIFKYVDLHFSAQEGRSGNGSASDNASRLRSTRNWWDPTYVDESYRGLNSSWPASEPNPGKIAFIPRMKQLIADEYPGLGLGVSEWYTQTDFVGALEIADTLGILGRYGLSYATKWADADANTAGAAAFWLYTGGWNATHGFPSHSLQIPNFFDPNVAGVYFASTSTEPSDCTTSGVFINKDPVNYQSYKISGWKDGIYIARHFGNPGVAQQQSLLFETTLSLDSHSTVVLPPYSGLFLRPY
ncbi:hypothetical protein HK100_011737 [Physocladia obscura]|uniref:Glycoside hydrolase family 44 catalytic domain-containing protein n=1 Tax=Physocladia obscura TaxID=109957 RepID=A0AAD5T0V1_9FUNG|nr:hypothetical protein HK100_011737 [Physocladia obscura]